MGLKYCGGCRERYDRVGAVARIRERLGKKIEFLLPDAGNLDLILVVTGCATACADVAPLAGRPVRYIKSEEDAERFISEANGN